MQRGIGLFDNVPPDVMQFGQGGAFAPKKVPELLGLRKDDVSRVSGVALSSVRSNDANLLPMRDRLEEVANTVNTVAWLFGGDVNKTTAWLKARNPMLGDLSPRDMSVEVATNDCVHSSSMQ